MAHALVICRVNTCLGLLGTKSTRGAPPQTTEPLQHSDMVFFSNMNWLGHLELVKSENGYIWNPTRYRAVKGAKPLPQPTLTLAGRSSNREWANSSVVCVKILSTSIGAEVWFIEDYPQPQVSTISHHQGEGADFILVIQIYPPSFPFNWLDTGRGGRVG